MPPSLPPSEAGASRFPRASAVIHLCSVQLTLANTSYLVLWFLLNLSLRDVHGFLRYVHRLIFDLFLFDLPSTLLDPDSEELLNSIY